MEKDRQENMVHHYAPCAYLPKILASGVLCPSNADGAEEIPLLWFSANQKWEPTATKAVGDATGILRVMTLTEQLQLFGCCRFSMTASDGRLMRWIEACRVAGRGLTKRLKMEASGRRMGANPADWFALADSIEVTNTAFSVFDGRVWKAADIAATATEWEALAC